MMSLTGRPEDPPTFCGASINDKATGMFCVIGALAALRQRDRTGRGCLVDTSLFETAVHWVEGPLNAYLADGQVPKRHGTGGAVIVPYQVFETADRPLCLAAGNDRLWARCAKVLGHPEWGTEARFATGSQRVRNKGELLPLIQAALRERTRAEWLDALAWRDRLAATAGQLFDAGWPEDTPWGPVPNCPLRERLRVLAAFAPVFEAEGFRFAEQVPSSMENGIIVVGGSALTLDAERFYQMVYDHGWVRPLEWSAWRDTPEGQRLLHDPAATATATADDLVQILTTCIRANRFCDGYLADAFDAGLITRVAVRAGTLLASQYPMVE